MGKEELFSKLNIKDYSKELEKVLDQKDFKEDTKNLLLDILYKIDVTYSDYNKVKIETLTKKEIIEELIGIVRDECKQIEIIKPKLDNQNITKKYGGFTAVNNINFEIEEGEIVGFLGN